MTREVLIATVIGAFAVAAEARALDRAGYLSVADRLQPHLETTWDEAAGRYDPLHRAVTTQVNADQLLVFAVAARHGHSGPARNDARARRIARFLTGPEAWTEAPLPDTLPRHKGPGWRGGPEFPIMHEVFGSEAAEGLAEAYRARDVLGLESDTVARIRDQIGRVAASPGWRWPAIRLNQFNWPVAMFAADATVNGNTAPLAHGLSRHLETFLAGAVGRGGAAGNLGLGLRFHYLPAQGARHRLNFDSPEYANVVLGFSRHYNAARAAGMTRPRRMALLRAWVRRALAGYWTHGGYLNWDTGFGFRRWHERKKVPLAAQALIGIAASPELQPGPAWGAWAKWLLDRSLEHYVELVERQGGIPPAISYGVTMLPDSPGAALLAAARHAANAMRALDAGLDARPAVAPPALFAFDPDNERLAITTPAYNTAIVTDNRGAFPYGGIEIARLFDSRQAVAATIGGVPPAAFGLRVRARNGHVVLQTQFGIRRGGTAARLRLDRVPHDTRARQAHAGPFTSLLARGSVVTGRRRAATVHRFTPSAIEVRWSYAGRHSDTATVTFPSWGSAARVSAFLRNGRSVAVGERALALRGIASLRVDSDDTGYRVLPLRRPSGATVRIVRSGPQPSAPHPGPTLEIALPRGERGFAARLTPRAPG